METSLAARPRLVEASGAATEALPIDECFKIFEHCESFSRTDEEDKKVRRLALIDAGVVPRLVTSLVEADSDEEKVAALAALSELAFGISDCTRNAAFSDPKKSAIAAAVQAFAAGSANSSARSVEIRVWACFALTAMNSENSHNLQHTWDAGALKVAFTYLASLVAAKECACSDCIAVKEDEPTDFSVAPAHEKALLSIAGEPFVTPSHSALLSSPSSSSLRSPLRSKTAFTFAATSVESPAASADPQVKLCRETVILQKAMTFGPHRCAMNCLGLFVMFSRDETMAPKLREMRLADCSPYYQLLKDRGVSYAALIEESEAKAEKGSNVDPGRLHHLARIATGSALFEDDVTALDLALHLVEGLDPFYSHIAASVVAFLAGADETDPFGLASNGAIEVESPLSSAASGAGSTASSASPVGHGHLTSSFARAQSRVSSGLPPQVVQMLLEAATAALKNQTYRGFAAYRKLWTYLRPLAVIGTADANKVTILKQGGVAVALESLAHPDERSRQYAAQLLWLLAFNEEAKNEILATKGSLDALRNAAKISAGPARFQCLGALWQLQAQASLPPQPPAPPALVTEATNTVAAAIADTSPQSAADADADDSASSGHLLLSYSWNEQPLVVAVKRELSRLGYLTWIDLEAMRGSTLEAMADAVEKASAVVVFCSQRYRQSANCRSEAEYAYRLGKRIIPVMAQANYCPDGWLGIIIGSRLYFDFSLCLISAPSGYGNTAPASSATILETPPRFVDEQSERLFEEKMRLLVKELGNEGKRGSVLLTQAPSSSLPAAVNIAVSSSSASAFSVAGQATRPHGASLAAAPLPFLLADCSCEAVSVWATDATGDACVGEALQEQQVDRAALEELQRLALADDRLFLTVSKEDLGLTALGPRLRLLAALRGKVA